ERTRRPRETPAVKQSQEAGGLARNRQSAESLPVAAALQQLAQTLRRPQEHASGTFLHPPNLGALSRRHYSSSSASSASSSENVCPHQQLCLAFGLRNTNSTPPSDWRTSSWSPSRWGILASSTTSFIPSLSKTWSSASAGCGSKPRTYRNWVPLPSQPSVVTPTRSDVASESFSRSMIICTTLAALDVSVIILSLL